MSLIFSVLCEPSYFCVKQNIQREKKEENQAEIWELGVRMCEEQENRKSCFT